eukprot:8261880-Pyramimonas_sp.AAC.1
MTAKFFGARAEVRAGAGARASAWGSPVQPQKAPGGAPKRPKESLKTAPRIRQTGQSPPQDGPKGGPQHAPQGPRRLPEGLPGCF